MGVFMVVFRPFSSYSNSSSPPENLPLLEASGVAFSSSFLYVCVGFYRCLRLVQRDKLQYHRIVPFSSVSRLYYSLRDIYMYISAGLASHRPTICVFSEYILSFCEACACGV